MQVCTLLQTNNHTSTPPLCFYRPDALPAAQPTASKHWRQHYEIQRIKYPNVSPLYLVIIIIIIIIAMTMSVVLSL